MMALTIGMFDGVHRGHRHLLEQLKIRECKSVALTFSNHPHETIAGHAPVVLTPLALKLALLDEIGLDEILVLPFSPEVAERSFEEFLARYPLRHLILGEGDAFGKNRLGTEANLRLLGLKRNFKVHVVPKLQDSGSIISSTRIRQMIQSGDLAGAEALLGRPYCFPLGSPQIALPPDGQYKVWAHSSSGVIPTTLVIRKGALEFSLETPQLISFGPHINPSLFNKLCQPARISPSAS